MLTLEQQLQEVTRRVNAEARVSVYGELLREVVNNLPYPYAVDRPGFRCQFCNEVTILSDALTLAEHVPEHTDDCLITRINRALAADADAIARMLDEWAQGRGA